MRRREFIAAFGGAVAMPFAAPAQQGERVRRIAVLMNLAQSDPEGQARLAALRDGLTKLGWTEGDNIQMEIRWAAGDSNAARTYAAELVALKPELIFAAATFSAAALQRETRTLPIVVAQSADPVAEGLVASLARPGGNITAFANFELSIGAKWVELLKQIAPTIVRVAALYDPGNPGATGFLPMIEAAARSLALEVSTFAVRDGGAVERTIKAFAQQPNGGLILVPSPITVTERDLIISLALRHRLPNVAAYRYYTANGGLAAYGTDNIDLYRRAASYVDRILKGEKAAELPVQQATKFELSINLKTARALGLEIPVSLLARTDEVIE
jgi:putative tryptophan/tyrosine transport system substrate-binding protein